MATEITLTQEQLTSIAHQIFDDYKAQVLRDGKLVEYENFEDQPADLQESNFHQARDLAQKVELLGCRIEAAAEAPVESALAELTAEQVDTLAKFEHDRWVSEREAAGWSYGPVKDVEAKKSPYLVPYEELSDDIAEYDRIAARNIIPLLASAGLAVCKS